MAKLLAPTKVGQSMKKALNWLSLLLVSTVLGITGCVTMVSDVTAFREPLHADKTYSKVGVFAQGMVLEAAVEVERSRELTRLKLAGHRRK